MPFPFSSYAAASAFSRADATKTEGRRTSRHAVPFLFKRSKSSLDLFGGFRRNPRGPEGFVFLQEVLGAVVAARLVVGHPGHQAVDGVVGPGALVEIVHDLCAG